MKSYRHIATYQYRGITFCVDAFTSSAKLREDQKDLMELELADTITAYILKGIAVAYGEGESSRITRAKAAAVRLDIENLSLMQPTYTVENLKRKKQSGEEAWKSNLADLNMLKWM